MYREERGYSMNFFRTNVSREFIKLPFWLGNEIVDLIGPSVSSKIIPNMSDQDSDYCKSFQISEEYARWNLSS